MLKKSTPSKWLKKDSNSIHTVSNLRIKDLTDTVCRTKSSDAGVDYFRASDLFSQSSGKRYYLPRQDLEQ